MPMPRRSVLAVLLVGLLATEARAGQPLARVQTAVDRVLTILDDPGLGASGREAERRAELRRAIEAVFDFDETARRALGLHWRGLTEPQRVEFRALFAELLERAYVSKFEAHAGARVVYRDEAIDGNHALVRTIVVSRQGTQTPVDYRMLRREGAWAVYDVVVEGVSLVANYRSQFARILASSSYEQLAAMMRSRIEALDAQERSATRE